VRVQHRDVWALFRKKGSKYGLGRSEWLPVRKKDAVPHYLGHYLECGYGWRQGSKWKGVRMIEADRKGSWEWRGHWAQFQFVSPGSALWRWQVGEMARRHQVAEDDFEGLEKALGRHWA
jgi:hypothetical protein